MEALCLSTDRDRLSSLPSPIIEDILCRLYSIQEAARTSILSRDWRYKWTKMPKLEFDKGKFKVSTDENQHIVLNHTFGKSYLGDWMKKFKFLHATYQVLLLHEGPIDEFALIMDADNDCVDIDHILISLSRNYALKKLTLMFENPGEYKLPLSIFSLHQLTHLRLDWCQLDHQPIFDGFGSLTSLCMQWVYISKKKLLHLLSKCPLLKDLTLSMDYEQVIGNDSSTITELFQCLPLIERLSIWDPTFQRFAKGGIPKVLPTTLVHLKFFELEEMSFIDERGLPFVLMVIRSSPNLEKLMLTILHDFYEESWMDPVRPEDHSDIWLEHLNELKIVDFVYLKNSMEFVKLILAKSPMLKTVRIRLNCHVTKDDENTILRTLLRSPRASPVVEIIV